MLAVKAVLGVGSGDRPAVVLVHGAANSARVWTVWQSKLARRGWPSYALDPPPVEGAARGSGSRPAPRLACVISRSRSARASSVPREYGILSADPAEQPTMPDLDLEERAVALGSLGRESRWARDDRKAGIVVMRLPCPGLIVVGSADATVPPQAYDDVPFPADRLEAAGASHWGLVLNRRVLATLLPAACAWMDKAISAGPGSWDTGTGG